MNLISVLKPERECPSEQGWGVARCWEQLLTGNDLYLGETEVLGTRLRCLHNVVNVLNTTELFTLKWLTYNSMWISYWWILKYIKRKEGRKERRMKPLCYSKMIQQSSDNNNMDYVRMERKRYSMWQRLTTGRSGWRVYRN